MQSKEYLNTIVDDMVEAFKSNLVDGEITPEGLSKLADLFGDSPIELRAVIYNAFVKEVGVEPTYFMGNC